MTRAELISYVAEKTNLSVAECDRVVRLLIDSITEKVAAGEKVTLSGFGTFERRRRKATMARNPKTLEPMSIQEQYVAAFRAGSALKEAVKSNDL